MTVTATVIEQGSPRQKYMSLVEIAKLSGLAMTQEWFRKYMPGHFRKGAVSKYGYRIGTEMKTKSRYRKRTKTWGDPLVKSGELRSEIRIGARHNQRMIKGKTILRAQAVMRGPRYTFITRRVRAKSVSGQKQTLSIQGTIADEITRMTSDEDAYLANYYKDQFAARMNEVSPRSRKIVYSE